MQSSPSFVKNKRDADERVRDVGDVSCEETVAAGGRSWLVVVGLVERQEGSVVGVWCCCRVMYQKGVE